MALLPLLVLATARVTHSSVDCAPSGKHATYSQQQVILLQTARKSKLDQWVDENGAGVQLESPLSVENSLATKASSYFKTRQVSSSVQIGGAFLVVVGVLLVTLKAFFPASAMVNAMGLASIYIVCSVMLIETNKWLMMPDNFPYPVALTTSHMAMSFFLANCLRYVRPTLFPSLEKLQVTRGFLFKIGLIGAAFASSIVFGNAAYLYMSVSFLQCIKEGHIVLIYALSVLVGLEALRRCSIVILAATLFGTILAIRGEMNFQMIGLMLQLVGSLSEACKVVTQGVLMSGSTKLDPLTMVFFMAPACLLANIIPLAVVDLRRWNELYPQLMLHWPMILVNACLAFALNIIVAQCIKQLSPVGFLLCGTVRDVSIVVTASLVLGESLSILQIVGFSIALSGVASYSLYKMNPDCFDDDSMIHGFARVGKKLSAKNDHTEGCT